MSGRTARRLLFAAALITLPVPFYLGATELSPVVRLAFLSSLLSAVALAEGGTTLALLAALGVVQTLLYALLLWAFATLLAWLLGVLRPAALRGVLVTSLAIALLAMSLLPIYQTPLSSTRPRSNLVHLFE